ncbi:MAG TPA: hypothetical protein PKI32_05600, partial [Opitutales bacterium]|nr:hypothetical protein [Opitutales bacterium]
MCTCVRISWASVVFFTVATLVAADVKEAKKQMRTFVPDAAPAVRLEAFRVGINGRLVAFECRLVEIKTRLNGAFGDVECLQKERALARLEVAEGLPGYIRHNLASAHPDGVCYAYLASDDMEEFLRYFEDELDLWHKFPREKTASASGNNPRVYDFVADFGAKGDGKSDCSPAWDRAVAAIAAQKGAPTILDIPAGKYLFLDSEKKNPLYNVTLTEIENLLVRGVSPELTVFVAGVYNKGSMCLSKCRNVAVRDLTIRTKETPFCQGKITDVDVVNAVVTIRHNPSSIPPDDAKLSSNKMWQCCTAYWADGQMARTQHVAWNHGEVKNLGGGLYRIQMDTHTSLCYLRCGMNLVIPNRVYHASAFSICDYSEFCSAERVHVRTSYAAAFGGAASYSSYKDCRVKPMEGLLYATNADSYMGTGGLYMNGFDVTAPGDDCLNDYVPSYEVGKVDGRGANPGRMHGKAVDGALRTFASPSTGQFLCLNR